MFTDVPIQLFQVPGLENGPLHKQKMESVDTGEIFGTIVYSIIINSK